MKRLCLMICVFGLILNGVGTAEGAIYDDFEDGVINATKWLVGGYKRGVDGGPGSGIGEWFNEEIIAGDGYLQARATAPRLFTPNTYGSEAWTRTVYNFNDGRDWIISFKWEPDVFQTRGTLHCDWHNIQITDGFTGWGSDVHAVSREREGTYNLYCANATDLAPAIWSILIDASEYEATLYKGPNGTGPIYSTKKLDPAYPWYLRFITSVGTNMAYPVKDCRINLYHFVARTPEEGIAPVADTGSDIIASGNEEVTLDGSNSTDPDGEIILYTWKRLPDEVVIYSGTEPTCQTRALGRVEEIIELTVMDNFLITVTDTVSIISRTTQDLKDQVAAMQSQIEELQRQIQELQALVDKIASWPPIKQWLRRAIE